MKFNENDIKGKVILITGASRGIGASLAIHAGKLGANCILLGRNLRNLEAVYDEIVKAGGSEPSIINMDLLKSDIEAYQQLAERIQGSYGRLDAIIHNATHVPQLTPVEHYDIAHWYKVMQTNVNAAFILTQALLPLLKQSDQGSIIFTTGGYAQGKAYWGAHACAYAATEALMRTLADELSNTKIRVNCIQPTATNTDFRRKIYPAENRQHLCQPSDLMPTYLHLLSMPGRERNGEILVANPKA
jgi:NAD(P)-dependent dehydrogenase (short-subunit alcohol dehydrogenase family)